MNNNEIFSEPQSPHLTEKKVWVKCACVLQKAKEGVKGTYTILIGRS